MKVAKINREIFESRKVRAATARRDPMVFMSVYMPEIISYPMAKMHHEMMAIAKNDQHKLAAIMAFRTSGKSTLLTMVYVLWSIIGEPQTKFIMLFGRTAEQARILLGHIKSELERNELLKSELGPFESIDEEWGASSIVLKRYNAKIMAASVDQSIRGIRFGKYRPQVILLDDVEDQQSVRTHESRDKLYRWFLGEVMPLGDRGTRIILIGNKLHNESLMMRIADSIDAGVRRGIARIYPIIGENGSPLWPGKYPDAGSVEEERQQLADRVTWEREYMQRIVAEESQLIKLEDLHYYEPSEIIRNEITMTVTSVDLAASQKDSADKTAILTAYVTADGEDKKIYLQPVVTNERLVLHDIIDRLKAHLTAYPGRLVVETGGTQEYVPQELERAGISVDRWKPSNDKYNRLYAVSNFIASGRLLLPETGLEELITQLTGFGTERYDDLVDALTMLILFVQQEDIFTGQIRISTRGFYPRLASERRLGR